MSQHKKVIIISVPYCEPLPLVAPVLLAGCLENAGISATGVDFNAQFLEYFSTKPYYIDLKNFLTSGHLKRPEFPSEAFKEIWHFTKKFLLDLKQQYQPEFIGLSIFTSESLDFGQILSYQIRRYLPDVTILAGGKGLEVSATDTEKHYDRWIRYSLVDAIVVGDAESAIIDVIKNNLRGLVFARPQTKEDLDSIPLAKWDDYDLKQYQRLSLLVDRDNAHEESEPYMAVTGSKGCVRRCNFCDVANFWPDFIYRDPIKVANEIIYNYRKTNIKKFKFTDNLINGSISNFRKMNQVLAEQIPNTITYGGYAIFRGRNQMPESDFELAAQAGNDFWAVGVESGSERLRYEMRKKFDNQDLDWSVNMLIKYQIKQNWLLMVGFPSESESDFIETKKLLERYSKYASSKLITIQITPTFMVLNNSPLLTDSAMSEFYGLDHLKQKPIENNKFWTSTKYLDNDYPTRSRRWKELMTLSENLNYTFGSGMPIQKWRDEIKLLDKIYHEQKIKVISISAK
jgi:radical SAM superfamily enzyme YgiQ (UPF0313 family)